MRKLTMELGVAKDGGERQIVKITNSHEIRGAVEITTEGVRLEINLDEMIEALEAFRGFV